MKTQQQTYSNKPTAIQTYEILSNWIVSSRTPEQLQCISNYIENVFKVMYPTIANPLYKEMASNLYVKIGEQIVNDES